MDWKKLVLVVAALSVGFIGGYLHFSEDQEAAPAAVSIPLQLVTQPAVPVADHSAVSDLQVSALQKQLEDLRRKSAQLTADLQSMPKPHPRAPAQRNILRQSIVDARQAQEERAENERLIAAGFTPERIKWLRHRGEERYSMALQDIYERQHKGLPIHPEVYFADEQLDLVKDVGEPEYDRYRQALGLPSAPMINSIQAGSLAETAGMRPGDEVIRYDGNRVYNVDQLKSVAAETRADRMVAVDIRRGGQLAHLTMPGGPIGADGNSIAQIKRGGMVPGEVVRRSGLQIPPNTAEGIKVLQ